MPKSMYDIIKNQNGERFAKAIRNYDNGIFDIPNLDYIVRYAGRDAEPIMRYLISLKGVRIQEHAVHMDPIALLKRAGYDAYVADTLSKQNAIRQYYAPGEELCTFYDNTRFERYHIINAVRHDVDKIRRSDFPSPSREDEYGTSVLSIQVLKSGGFISIKNRYNHTVSNPDNTYNSNPDNIIPGLSDAIKHHFNVDFSAMHTTLPENYILVDGRIFSYICELNNTYIGSDFYITDGVPTPLNPGHQLMLGGGLMLDMREKSVKNVTGGMSSGDFITNAISGKSVQLIREPSGGKSVIANGEKLFTVRDGLMSSLNIANADSIKLEFMNFTDFVDFGHVKHLDLVYCNFNNGFRVNPDAESIKLEHVRSRGSISVQNVKKLNLKEIDGFQVLNINPNADSLSLEVEKGVLPSSTLDVSNVRSLSLQGCSWSMIRIDDLKLNPNAVSIFLANLSTDGVVDCRNVSEIDMHNVRSGHIIINPSAKRVHLSDVIGLYGTVDFSNVSHVMLYNTNLENIDQVIWNKDLLYFGAAIGWPTPPIRNFDFSQVKRLELSNLDLTNRDFRFNPNASELTLHYCSGLSGELDFSGVKNLSLSQTNLSDVTSIKLNPSGTTFPSAKFIMQTVEKNRAKQNRNVRSAVQSDTLPPSVAGGRDS
ncbi:MAG: hypothetical protein E7011_04925 [Alphaproteobacteria bacterium]|nr:hypothetical protein [Alphaproteobacteria bacterium]